MAKRNIFYKNDLEPDKLWLNKEYLVQLNLTGSCPCNCDFCYIRNYRNIHMTLKSIRRLWGNLNKYNKEKGIVYRVNLTGGDIFYNPEWKKICLFLSKQKSVVAVDPLINRFWKREYRDLLKILNKKINYIQLNTDVVKNEDLDYIAKKDKIVVLKISLYKGKYKKDFKKLKRIVSKFDNVRVSIDIILPQKDNCLSKKRYILENYGTIKKSVIQLRRIFKKKLWTLSTIVKREVENKIYFCPIPFGGVYIMPDGKVVPCSRYSHLKTGFSMDNFDLFKYVKKYNKLVSNFCLYENKYFEDFWDSSENPKNFYKLKGEKRND